MKKLVYVYLFSKQAKLKYNNLFVKKLVNMKLNLTINIIIFLYV